MEKVILENNSFTMDTRKSRLTRLKAIRENIHKYSAELSLSVEMVEWSQSAYSKFYDLLNEQDYQTIRKQIDFSESNKSEKDFYDRYIVLKELIISKKDKPEFLKNINLDKPFPSNKDKRFETAEVLLKHAENKWKEFEEISIPQILFQNLEILTKKAKMDYQKANGSRELSKVNTENLNRLFDNDSNILRELYNWIVAFWSKKNPNLIDLGFTLPFSVSKGLNTPSKPNLILDKGILSWNELENSNIYQIAWRDEQKSLEWYEVETTTDFSIQSLTEGQYKVRGCNENGWGIWSEEIIYQNN